MRDVEDGGAEIVLDVLQLQPQIGAQLGVERGERLVHQIDGRAAHQRAADRDALHLAAGKLRRAVLELGRDAEHAGDLLDARLDLRLAAARRAGERSGKARFS